QDVVVGGSVPVADFSWSPLEPLVGERVVFADASSDADGILVKRSWRVGGVEVGSGPRLERAFAEPGVVLVELSVVDDAGFPASVVKGVGVGAEALASGASGDAPAGAPFGGGWALAAGLVAFALVAFRRHRAG
ncbi:MAG: PKD domain-containing protein, partial [bacterium]